MFLFVYFYKGGGGSVAAAWQTFSMQREGERCDMTQAELLLNVCLLMKNINNVHNGLSCYNIMKMGHLGFRM